ncbi:MAG: hypothetical protein WBN40_10785 [Pseudomonadales bacterium]
MKKFRCPKVQRHFAALVLLVLAPDIWAAEPLLYGASLSAGYRYEEYRANDGLDGEAWLLDASLYTSGNRWSAGLHLPWQTGDGVSTFNASTIQLLAVCRRLTQLEAATLVVLASRNDRVKQLIQQCRRIQLRDVFEQESVSGFSDISFDIGYSVSHGQMIEQSLRMGMVITGDNGDVDRGLGSGTVDAAFDLYHGWYFSLVDVYLGVGYNMVLGGRLADLYDDYTYASFDVRRRVGSHVAVSIGGYWSEASLPGGDDSRSANAMFSYRLADAWRLTARYTNYLDLRGYPEHEYSAGLSFSY